MPLLAGLSVIVAPRPAAAGAAADRQVAIAPGLDYVELRRSPDLVAHVARIAPGSGFEVRPVVASGRVGSTTAESTSEACRRIGGVVCVNADFAACPTCREPYGGVVVDGRVLRSPHHAHEQVTVSDGGLTSAALVWAGRLVAEYVWRAPSHGDLVGGAPGQGLVLRRERRELPLAGLNIGPVNDGTVLYTPDWGLITPTPPRHLEVLLATAGPVMPGTVGAEIGDQRWGAGRVPAGGAVLAAQGAAADELDRFAAAWRTTDATERALVVETVLTLPARHSVGGHPVLLRDGQRQSWWTGDHKAQGRHPRTLIGWTPSGEVLLVVADGRAAGHSRGLTLEEAADLLQQLGASDGVNLDGGGSSTFVGPCPSGPCVLNRPSDGRERLLPVSLAVVGGPGRVNPVVRPSTPPLAPPAPPPPDDPASTAHTPPPDPEPEPSPVSAAEAPLAAPANAAEAVPAPDEPATVGPPPPPLPAVGGADSPAWAPHRPSVTGDGDAGGGSRSVAPLGAVAAVLAAGVAGAGGVIRRRTSSRTGQPSDRSPIGTR